MRSKTLTILTTSIITNEGPDSKPRGKENMKMTQVQDVPPHYHQKDSKIAETVNHYRTKERMQSCINMKTPIKNKKKASQVRAIKDVIFSSEMAALDFEPTREDETFLQLIGLDRFVTRVTWKIINTSVFQEVISNLNLDTMGFTLNGQVFPIFTKDWRNKMKTIFYITKFLARRESCTPKVRAVEIIPNYHDKMRTKAGTCKIADYTIREARRP